MIADQISFTMPCAVASANVGKYPDCRAVREYLVECPFINLTSKAQHQTLRGVNTLAGMSGHAEKKLQQQTDLIRRGFRKYLRAPV